MRVSVLVLLAACSVSGNEGAQEPSRDGFFARTGAHTGDTQDTFNGLPLDPQLDSCVEDLAVCDVDYCALDLEGSAANDTCVHSTAIIDGTFGAGVTIKSGAEIGRNAHLSDGATLGVNSILAPFARVHEDAEIGDGTVIGRRAIVGARSEIGPDSRLNRASEVGADVDAVIGDLTMGYASFLGARSRVLGTNVILGSQARIGADSTLYGNVVVARGATFLNHTLLETGVIVGPNVQAGHHVTLRAHVRVRKNATFENNIEVGSGSRIGRDSSLREGSSVGSDSTIRANVTVGTNQHLDEDTYAPHGTVYEDLGGVVLDYPPVVEITSPTDGVDGDGGSLTLAGTVSDDNGVTSMTYRIDDGAESAMLFSGGLWSVPVSFPDRTQTIRITAYDALGQTGSDLLFVSDCNPSGTIHHTWTGAVDSTWSEAGNWSPSGPPSSTDSIFVCGATTNQPVLTAPASVGDAYLDYSAFVDTNDFKLTVTDDIAGGTIGGTGTVEMSGTGTIKGTVSNLRINGFSTLSGYVRATGNLTILASKYLQVNAKTLQVDGNYTSSLGTVNYGLMMHHDASDVTITGDALFNGAGTMYPTLMTTGIVRVGGNFSVASADVLRVEGTTFEFNGTAPQLVTFNRSHTDESYFYHLSITNPTAVTLVDTNETNFYAKGNLTIANGGTLNTIENFKVAGTTHLLEEATYNGTNVLDVTGTITVSDISTMAAARLRARSYLNMDPSAILTGNRVELYTKMVIPSDDYTATETHIAGLITLADDWNHAMPHLVIDAGKYLQVNGKTMVLDGNFTQSLTTGSYGLRMHHTTSDVTITGDATFGGSGTMSSGTLANGIVRVAGHFIVSAPYVFRPNGTRFELNGTAAQNVTFTHSGAPYSWFHHLRVRNPNTVTIVATSTTTVQVNGDLDLLNGTTVTTGESVTALGTASLSEGSTYNGTAVLDVGNTITIADTSTMNANTLRARWYLNMHTAAILTGNRVELYGKMAIPSDHYSATETHIAGRITLEGNWVHTMPHLIIDASQYLQVNAKTMILDGDFTSTLGTVNYGLMMHHDDSDVTITGNATFTGAGTMYPTLMTKGIVRVAGDFTVTSADVLRAEGTTFEFNGATPQLVTFNRSHTDESYFYHLSVTNPTTVTLVDTNESNFYAKGNLTVRNGGTLTTIENFKVGGTVQLLEGATYHGTNVLDVSGTITIADTSTMDAATLHARSYLNMAPTSSLTGNHVYLYSKMVIPSDNYTAGQTHLSGLITLADDWDHTMPHLVIDAGKYLQVNGKTMVLDGNFTQSLTTGSYGLRMHHTTSDVTITGDATFGGSGTMSSGTLANGIVRVAGDFTVSAPYVFRPNGARIELNGTDPQDVTFTHSGTPYSWFHHLRVNNSTTVDIVATSTTTVQVNGDLDLLNGTTVTSAENVSVGGTASLSQISTWDGTAVLDVTGTVTIADTSTMDAHTLRARWYLNMDTTAFLTGSRVDLYGKMAIPSDHYTATETHIAGRITLEGNWVHTMPHLLIDASQYLQVNGWTMILDGDFTSTLGTVNYGLMMQDIDSDVTITGDAIFTGAGTMHPTLMTKGIVRVAGDFTVTSADVLRAEGTTFEFNGASPQLVTFNRSHTDESYFYHLSVTNPTTVTLVDTNESNFYAKGNLAIANGGTLSTIENFTVGGAAHLSADATYHGTNVLDVGGTITVADTSTMDAATLRARSYLNMATTSVLTGNRVDLYSKMVIPSDDYTATETHIAGLITLAANWDHTMPHLLIDAGKYLQVNGKTVVLDGNFTQSLTTGSYGLRMHHTTSDVTITGDATFGGSGTMSSGTLANGIVRVAGDFTVSAPYVFRPNGARIELNGTDPQDVTFTHSGTPYSWFHHLRVNNLSTVDIAATSTTTVQVNGDLDLLNGTTVTSAENVSVGGTASLSQISTWDGAAVLDVTGTITVADTSTMDASTLRARWYLNMAPTAVLTGSRVDLYGKMAIPSDNYSATQTHIAGRITLEGDWDHAMPHLVIDASKYLQVNGWTMVLDGNFTSTLGTVNYGLMMQDIDSDVTITGDAIFTGAGTMHPTLMTTGIVRVAGDFTVTSADVLRAEGTTFEFNGTSPQLVTFNRSHTDESYFYHLSITNPTTVTLVDTNESNFYAKGNLTVLNGGTLATIENFKVGGTAHLSAGATYDGTNVLDVNGAITVADTSTMDAATLHARSYLDMDPTAYLTGNHVYLYSKMVIPSDNYTAGQTHIAGLITLANHWDHTMPHLLIDAGKYLQVNGKTMVLDGNFTQSLTTGSYGLRMHHTTSDVTITGDATFGGSGTMSSGTLANGIVRVAGHFIVSAPYVFRPNGTHFEFDGTAAQNVTFTHSGTPYSWFHNVTVSNGSAAGVTYGSNVYSTSATNITGKLVNNGTATSAGGLTIASGGTLDNTGNVWHYGSSYTQTGTLIGNTPVL